MRATRPRPVPDPFLLEPQLRALAPAAEGMTPAEIGRTLGLATGTVSLHLSCARRRVGCTTLEDLVAEARRRGLI